jgi:hypothetical protein
MKSILLLFALCHVAQAQVITSGDAAASGMTYWFSFADGTTANIGGSSTAAVVGTVPFEVLPTGGKAASFNGNNANRIFDFSSFLIGNNTNDHTIHMRFTRVNATRAGLCATRSGSGGGWSLEVNGANLSYFQAGNLLNIVSMPVGTNQWEIVTVTVKAKFVTLYRAGEAVVSSNFPSAIGGGIVNGIIGNSEGPTSYRYPFNGLIDYAIFWSRALSANEVRQLVYPNRPAIHSF